MNLRGLFILIFAFCNLKSKYCSPVLNIALGPITGNEITAEGKRVYEFVGIPYAIASIGNLRFAKPVPVTKKWKTPYPAQSFSNSCYQNNREDVSEDCLYINVWNVKSNATSKLKPVLFWTYGGAFVTGSAKDFNGSALASLSDCVVVNYNYRLGALGFLFGNTERTPGNVGLFDQLLAMKWVNENIEYFGGDKNQVTIFGESAGSISTSLHLISPLSRPYYNRVILMSGVGMDFMIVDNKKWALRRSKALAEVFGCNATENSKMLTKEQIQCLQLQDPKALLHATDDERVKKAAPPLSVPVPFLPIFKDEFLPCSPRKMWRERKFKRNIDLLIGTVYNEFPVAQAFPSSVKPSEAARAICRNLPEQFLTNTECEDLIKIYFAGVDEDNDHDSGVETAMQMFTDLFFLCETSAFAEVFSDVNTVHQYYFVYKSKNDNSLCGPKYPCHGSDLQFTFADIKNAEDREPTLKWVQILANFEKTGDVFWPAYYRTSLGRLVPVYFEFNGTYAKRDTKVALNNFRCSIWKSMVFTK